MIDTTKTTNQKRKEAAAARRNEKALQKQAAKLAMVARSVPVTINASHENSEVLPSAKQDASMASESAALKPRNGAKAPADSANLNSEDSAGSQNVLMTTEGSQKGIKSTGKKTKGAAKEKQAKAASKKSAQVTAGSKRNRK